MTLGFSIMILGSATSITSGFSIKQNVNSASISIPTKRQNIYKPEPIAFSKTSTNRNVCLDPMLDPMAKRGGSISTTETLHGVANVFASLWAAGGFVAILGKSIKRILPIALEPFSATAPGLSPFQLGSYIAMCLMFAYAEGYKGFQLKFSPLVVARAQTLKPFQGTPIHHVLLGPFYAMGLFHATKKRRIVSWSVSTGVAFIVAIVKKFPYPWRNIIDAGVIVGLSWGSMSILAIWFKTVVLGQDSGFDPALPQK